MRVARNLLGEWVLGRGDGRGAWICRAGECGERVMPVQLSRTLRYDVVDADVEVVKALMKSVSLRTEK